MENELDFGENMENEFECKENEDSHVEKTENTPLNREIDWFVTRMRKMNLFVT